MGWDTHREPWSQSVKNRLIALAAGVPIVVLAAIGVQAQDVMSVTVSTATHGELGTYLVDRQGRSLYLFLADEPGVTQSNCFDICAETWPALTTNGDPVAESAVNADFLGAFMRTEATRQATYNGWPLYYHTEDERPGDINGHDVEQFGAAWHLVTPEGEAAGGDDE
jgi:predicted lipoprotein with Yx(FWY)xxD motif